MKRKSLLKIVIVFGIFLSISCYFVIKGDRVDLGGGFSRDNLKVYKDGHSISGVDVGTFEVIDNVYAKDKNAVYYSVISFESGSFADKIEDADPSSFKIIVPGFFGYAKDSQHVFIGGKPIIGADPETFQHLKGEYSRDKNFLYHGFTKMPDADLNTLEFLEDETRVVAKDKNAVYYQDKKIINVDPKTFTLLGRGYARDNSNLYHLSTVNEGAIEAEVISTVDLPTLEVINSEYARDTHVVYHHVENRYEKYNGMGAIAMHFPEKPVIGSWRIMPDVARDSFKILPIKGIDEKFNPGHFAKDKNNVYYTGVSLQGADPKTFEVLHKIGYAKDVK